MSLKNTKCAYSSADTKYAMRALVSLVTFRQRNSDFDLALFGRSFDDEQHAFAKNNNVKLFEVDLSHDFTNTWGVYPIECFYLFAGPSYLRNYKVVMYMDGDIYCNKTLDIDFSAPQFSDAVFAALGGKKDMRSFPALYADREIIKETWPQARWDRRRLQSGIVFFNVERALETNFYEKIVELFKTSLEKNAPRKGDDSLLSLWYMLADQTKDVFLLKRNYNAFGEEDAYLKECCMFHFLASPKPWDDRNHVPKTQHVTRYFMLKWQEQACKLLSREQLVTLMPQFNVELPLESDINFYWYSHTANFGDFITPYFLRKCCNINVKHAHEPALHDKTCTVVSTGSIYRLVNENALVFGSGVRDRDQSVQKSNSVFCVRGPLTRRRVLAVGDECPPIYGDPALLLARVYNPPFVLRYKLGIVPHVSQYKKVLKLYDEDVKSGEVFVVDLRTINVESVVRQILQCERVVSSSLHGIIVCHSYGIPVRWIRFDNNINGDDTKYHDHFAAVDLPCTHIDAVPFKRVSPNDLLPQIKPQQIRIDLDRLEEAMFFDKDGLKTFVLYAMCNVFK